MLAVLGALRRYRRVAAFGLMGLCSLACGRVGTSQGIERGSGGSGETGGSANTNAGTAAGDGAGMVGAPGQGGRKLRLLTQSEYKMALSDLLGTISTPLVLPEDTSLAGFVSIGASQVAVNSAAVSLYEAASRAVTAEVFADALRWHELVGCEPPADLNDACVVSFIQRAGKRAYRRDLTDVELQRWLQVGSEAAQLPGSSTAQGLATVTYGLLQSFNFLYRVESNQLDRSSGRLKYDGASMATRLAFLLTGGPPSDALLAAAAAGQLDTADGVRAAAAPLLSDPSAVEQMAEFFGEVSQARFVSVVQKSPELFPTFNAALQSSMLQATQLFIKNVVLAPQADVRSFFDSDQTFVDAALAPIYGVSAPASGFVRLELGPETGRAGILGQAAVIAGHSQPDRGSPTRRGVFILQNLLCQTPPAPPAGVVTNLPPVDANLTTRQKLAQHLADPTCLACHELIDPLGFALEHFDAIGQYRATEGGLPIDATGTLDGVAFDGEAQLAAALAASPRALSCLLSNFYRDANGLADATADSAQIDDLGQTLASHGYAWQDLVGEFVASDAFRSAPNVPITAGNQ
ncbi:MAG TPA: DUF1588 domain-containing protein [Polyangiaceae bacterium]|nr:DUF1588 domain-containing protein [Polyangiaceae bacterium]